MFIFAQSGAVPDLEEQIGIEKLPLVSIKNILSWLQGDPVELEY